MGALRTIGDGTTLDVGITIGPDQALAFAGTITNAGTNALAGSLDTGTDIDHGATMEIAANATFTGGGTSDLSDAADLIAGGGSAQIALATQTIVGVGTIDGLSQLSVAAGATLEASGGTLVVDATTVTDLGFVGAAAGSTLIINGVLDSTLGATAGLIIVGGGGGLGGGVIASGQIVEIGAGGATFTGITNNGEILTDAGALLQLQPTTTNAGKIVVNGDATLRLFGAVSNSDLIALQGFTTGAAMLIAANADGVPAGVHPATLQVSGGEVTLDGGGTITLQPTDLIDSLTATDTLDNVDNTIEGSGTLGGSAGLNLLNFGAIDADTAGASLTLDGGGDTLFNSGLMEATAGGTLAIDGPLDNFSTTFNPFPPPTTVDVDGGVVLASGAGSEVLLNGSIENSLLRTNAGGIIAVTGNAVLQSDGDYIQGLSPTADPGAMALFADLRVLGGTLTLRGDIANFETISVLSGTGGSAPAALLISGSSVLGNKTGAGNGTIQLGGASSGTANSIGAAGPGATLEIASQTIEGFGTIGDGVLVLTNFGGLIDADVTGTSLLVQSAGTLANDGPLQASAGGTLVLTGTISQANVGDLDASSTGTIELGGTSQSADIIGGYITSSTAGVVQTNGAQVTLDGSGAGGYVTLFGLLSVQAGDTLTITDGLVNNGTLALGDGSGGATLLVAGTGLNLPDQVSADIVLASTADIITGSSAGQTLVNQQNTITGGGTIGGGIIGIANLAGGTFDATVAMTIDTGANTLQNSGLLEATTGNLLITGAVFNNIDTDPDTTAPNSGTIEADGGTVEIDGAITGAGVLKLVGGTMLLQGGVSGGQTIDISGFAPELLELGMPTTAPLVFTNFQSVDTIDLENVLSAGSSFTSGVLHVSVGAVDVDDFQFPAGYALNDFARVPDGDHGTDVVIAIACFAEGTHILTATGEVRVEALRVGDRVATASGGRLARIKWLGHRHVDCRRHPDPHLVSPIRVRADAFAPGAPHADLLLSPDHAVLVGGGLIPVRHLVNGSSISQQARDRITYWHVELAGHDILLAEGLAAESYLDTGNRDAFRMAERQARRGAAPTPRQRAKPLDLNKWVPRAFALAGPGQSPSLASLPPKLTGFS